MSGQIILVTGSTGFLGSHLVDQLLKHPENYIVRLAVRNVSKGQELVHLFDSNPRLQLAVVPDLQKSTSFSEAIKGVSAIIHSASPFIVMTDNVERDLFEPAINITTAVLEAAFKEPSVKRIVLTSSFAAVVDLNRRFEYEYTYTEKDVNNFPKEDAIKEVPLSYEVSKSLAEKAAWSFIETRKPAFDLVVFNPVMIYGQPLQKFKTPLEINTSNLLTYALLYGAVPVNPLPFFVDVQDVAKLHVAALENKVASNQRYILCSGFYSWPEVIESIRSTFPEAAARLSIETQKPSPPAGTISSSKVRNDFNFQFRNWNASIVEGSVGGILENEKAFKPDDIQKFIGVLKSLPS